jgi:hypothetical protein
VAPSGRESPRRHTSSWLRADISTTSTPCERSRLGI